MAKARASLDWNRHFELAFDPDTARALHGEDMTSHEDYCAMCGHDWCAVRISRELIGLTAQSDAAAPSAEGTAETQTTEAGPSTADKANEIDQLASATGSAVGTESGRKPACHSDHAQPEKARIIQQKKLAHLG